MNIGKRSSSGFSLVELLITMIISTIMCAVIGTIIIYANQSWKKAQAMVVMSGDGRNAKSAIEYRLRQAVTLPFATSGLPYHFLSTSEPFIISGGVGVSYNVIDWSADHAGHTGSRYRHDRFTYDASTSKLLYEYWYATTAGSLLSFPASPSGSALLLNDASGFTVTQGSADPNDWLITITQSKNVNGQVLTSATTFRVRTRIYQP